MTSEASSFSPVALGEQAPRYRHCPAGGKSLGPVVAHAALLTDRKGKSHGLNLDIWQRDCITDALRIDPETGLWATPRVAVSVPRQNGKGAIIEALELAFILGAFPDARLLIHSAHEFKTARNAFERIQSLCESYPAFRAAKADRRLVIKTANAQESITFEGPDGVIRTIKFMARSKGSGRGFSADFIILDEAQELSDQVWAAMLPTISARPNPQVWLFGTPPDETMNGEVFARLRDNGIAAKDPRLAYFEWSAADDEPFDDPKTWAKANPAFPHRIAEATIRDEFLAMGEETFCRERLGMWDGAATLSVIPEDTWAALAGETDPDGRVVFAIDVSPDRQRASIGVAGLLADDRVMVQAIENRKGTGWVVPRLKELTERWPYIQVIVDSGGAAASLLPELKRAKVRRVNVIGASDVVRSCGGFYDAAMEGRLSHPDQPVLNEALASARKRPLENAWAWQRKDTTADITPLVAVTFAAYGLSLKRNAARRETSALVL